MVVAGRMAASLADAGGCIRRRCEAGSVEMPGEHVLRSMRRIIASIDHQFTKLDDAAGVMRRVARQDNLSRCVEIFGSNQQKANKIVRNGHRHRPVFANAVAGTD